MSDNTSSVSGNPGKNFREDIIPELGYLQHQSAAEEHQKHCSPPPIWFHCHIKYKKYFSTTHRPYNVW